MYAKIKIAGVLEIATGLHIGASGAFSAIGAVDSPVIRDALEPDKPLIPGSSLKGKMRTLLAKQYNSRIPTGKNETPDTIDDEKILRLFGSAKHPDYRQARLLFSDMILANGEELRRRGADTFTEVKFENTINRLTAEANPRQIERVIRGSKFDLSLIYEVNRQTADEVLEDFGLIGDGFRLLSYDYLGGSGSRGYGKVAFSDLAASVAAGEVEGGLVDKVNEILSKAV
ncbi:MAG: type III-A CRISPR-associated RAMP protein Csm3 [Oscillospiraceae bacterium]|nr:type III-A CRISPR-associated RAMP protein Csm3 [Oscillospiraceae bacterium]